MPRRNQKSSIILRVYAVLLCVIFGGIVVTAPFSVGFGTLFPDHTLLIKSWKEILMGIALVLAAIEVSRRHMWHELMRDVVLRLIAGFAALHVLLLVWHWQGATPAAAGILIDLRYLLFFALMYTLFRMTSAYRTVLLVIGALGAEVVVIFGALQLFLPHDVLKHIGYGPDTIEPYLTVDKNPDYVRINSTLRGPNPLGAYSGIVLAMLASVLAYKRRWLSTRVRQVSFVIVALCALVTLWMSYSRSALLAAVLMVAIVAGVAWKKWFRHHLRIVVAGVVAICLVGAALLSQSSFVDNVIRHDNPGTGAAVTSDDAHLTSLKTGANRLVHQPLGAGIGSTGSASMLGDTTHVIENQYFFVAHESGWLGLGLYIAILWFVLKRAWRERRDWLALGVFASGIGLLAIGMLLPVFADDTVSIVWWGLVAMVYAGVESRSNGRKSSHKKTA